MSFKDDFREFSQLLSADRTLKLLRAENAPLIMGFLRNTFQDESEVDYVDAREHLTEYLEDLKKLRPEVGWQSASFYFREWMDSGWIRELNNRLTMTDAAQKAISFCNVLRNRVVSTSSTHLQILQSEIQNLYLRISVDRRTRIRELKRRKKELDVEIELIRQGLDRSMTEAEQREKIRAIYDLASRLPNDFRKLEEECREDDKRIRIRMTEMDQNKGEVLKNVLELEDLHRQSDYGAAYEGFYRLISDKEIRDTFTARIRSILNMPIASNLNDKERLFMLRLVDRLNMESSRIIKIRQRIDENLRSFIESTNFEENKQVAVMLRKLEKVALELKKTNTNLSRSDLDLSFSHGSADINSIQSIVVKEPEAVADFSGISEQKEETEIRDELFDQMDTVRMRDVRDAVDRALEKADGPVTVAEIIGQNEIRYGIQEVICYLRIASELTGGPDSDASDEVVIDDDRYPGRKLKLKIPHHLLQSEHMKRDGKREENAGAEA